MTFWRCGRAAKTYVLPRRILWVQNKQMTAVGYVSDTEEIFEASWSLFHDDGAAVFKLSERSLLPPALSAKDLPGGRT